MGENGTRVIVINQNDPRYQAYLTARRLQQQFGSRVQRYRYTQGVNEYNFNERLYIRPIPQDQVIGSDAWFRRQDAIRARRYQAPVVAEVSQGETFSSSTNRVGSHPIELGSLISSVRNYYGAVYRTTIPDPARPSTPSRNGIPRGFPLLPGGGVTYLSTYPSYCFINRTGPDGRAGVFYRHRNSSNSYWRCMTPGYDNAIFQLRGGRGVSSDRSYMVQVNGGTSSSTASTPPPGGASGGTTVHGRLTTRPTSVSPTRGSRNVIPPRIGDAVGYSPRPGQTPIRTEVFNTDLTNIRFQVRINARNQFVGVEFQPLTSTTRSFITDRRGSHQNLWDAGIRIVPQFATETHRGSRRPWQSQTITGFRLEFYNRGNYLTTTRENFYSWSALDGTARAANASRYPVRNAIINTNE